MQKNLLEQLIRIAQAEAGKATLTGNPPFGAVITNSDGIVVVASHNTQNSDHDPTAHAEINALRQAGRQLGSRYLDGCRLFTNAEPCPMCMTAVIKARILHVYFSAPQESGSNPSISAAELASRAEPRVLLEGFILADKSIKQIQRGRKKIDNSSPSCAFGPPGRPYFS